MLLKSLITALGVSIAGANAAYSLEIHDYDPKDVVYADVAVIGGGSSGTYTAVRLKDHEKKVVLVEKEAKLGGHAQTYTAPNGYTIDYGVIVFAQMKIVEDYFSRFNVPLAVLSSQPSTSYIDFSSGETVDFVPPNATSQGAAFEAYAAQLAKYPSLQQGFNMSYPVAADLLLTFGEFVEKYDLGALVPTTFVTNQGYAPILKVPMLYMFKYLNSDQLNSTFNGYLTTANHNIYALYAAAGAYLGAENVFTSSIPLAMNRTSSPVKILIKNSQTGSKKLIVAQKLVSTIPPTLHNLRAYDLSAAEKSLFAKWKVNGYYCGILNNTGLNTSVRLVSAQPHRPYGVPKLPGVYSFAGSPATGLTLVYYGSPHGLPSARVKADIEATLRRVRKASGSGGGGGLDEGQEAEWVVFSSHAPFNLEVDVEEVAAGFYERLQALQGGMNTFWNGAAWQAQDSSALWRFSEDYVVPRVLGAL